MVKEKRGLNIQFPNDADGDVLRGLYEDGVDFSKPHTVDFSVVVKDEETGNKLVDIITHEGFACYLSKYEETGEWTCYCSKEMILNYNEIIKLQYLLDKLSEPYEGYSDGWGTFGE